MAVAIREVWVHDAVPGCELEVWDRGGVCRAVLQARAVEPRGTCFYACAVVCGRRVRVCAAASRLAFSQVRLVLRDAADGAGVPLDHATVAMDRPHRDVCTQHGTATLACRALAAVPRFGLVLA